MGDEKIRYDSRRVCGTQSEPYLIFINSLLLGANFLQGVCQTQMLVEFRMLHAFRDSAAADEYLTRTGSDRE